MQNAKSNTKGGTERGHTLSASLITTFPPEILRWRLSESVDDRETSEPPRTQFVKETETFLSVDLIEGMVAVWACRCKRVKGSSCLDVRLS